MRTAYFNCARGVAGDMILAACIDAGVNARALERKLKKDLKVMDWRLKTAVNPHTHYPAVQVAVEGTRSFAAPAQMRAVIVRSGLTQPVKTRALAIFDCLVDAEARVHAVRPADVHFHELNAIDTLVDIVGACVCFDMLGITQVHASAVNVGDPAPATLAIARRYAVPVTSSHAGIELATPTGMAIMARVAGSFGPFPAFVPIATGIGSGTLIVPGGDNVLKLMIADGGALTRYERDTVRVLETNIDDMDPRVYPHVMDLLFAAGARDVWLAQVLMKKGRPGIVLSALCDERNEQDLLDILFRETTTLGVRRSAMDRAVLHRRSDGGVKTGFVPGSIRKKKGEYEVVRARAIAAGTPLKKLLR